MHRTAINGTTVHTAHKHSAQIKYTEHGQTVFLWQCRSWVLCGISGLTKLSPVQVSTCVLQREKSGRCPLLATGHFSARWVVSFPLHPAMPAVDVGITVWGQEPVAWGWFAPISASSLHYILIPSTFKLLIGQCTLHIMQNVQCETQNKICTRLSKDYFDIWHDWRYWQH